MVIHNDNAGGKHEHDDYAIGTLKVDTVSKPIAAKARKDQSYCERGGKESAQCVIQLQFAAEEWHERAKHGLCKPDVGQHGVCQPSQSVTGEWLY